MPIESATYIADLISTYPLGTDDRSTSDDHHRLIKAVLLASLGNIEGAVLATEDELNLLAGYIGSIIPDFDVLGDWNKQQTAKQGTLTDATNITWNLDDNQIATVTLGGNRTLDNPTTIRAGGSYVLVVKQDATGDRTLTFGSAFKFPLGEAPVLSTDINAVDIFTFVSPDGTNLYGSLLRDFG